MTENAGCEVLRGQKVAGDWHFAVLLGTEGIGVLRRWAATLQFGLWLRRVSSAETGRSSCDAAIASAGCVSWPWDCPCFPSVHFYGEQLSFGQESASFCKNSQAEINSASVESLLPAASRSTLVLSPVVPSCILHIRRATFDKSTAQTLKEVYFQCYCLLLGG